MINTRLPILLMLLSSSGCSKNQEVPGMKLSLSLPDLHEDPTVSWFCNSTNLGTYYSGGTTNVRKNVSQNVELSGPTTLTFLELISGNYSAKVTGNQTKRVLDCNITFPESPGERRVDVISNIYCKLEVTCSMEDVEINSTFICKNKTCHQEGGERSKNTKSGAPLRLHQSNSTIICSHSNQEQNVGLYVFLGVLGGLLLLLLGVALCAWCILKKKFNNRRERSRSETSPDVPLQTFQPIPEGNEVISSRDEEMGLNESGSDSGISFFTGKSLQGDDEEEL